MRNARRGTVLMEYAVLLFGMTILVESVALAIWDFQSPWGGSFGELGVPVVHLYQRIVSMISLPFP